MDMTVPFWRNERAWENELVHLVDQLRDFQLFFLFEDILGIQNFDGVGEEENIVIQWLTSKGISLILGHKQVYFITVNALIWYVIFFLNEVQCGSIVNKYVSLPISETCPYGTYFP